MNVSVVCVTCIFYCAYLSVFHCAEEQV